jgi:hypothetical protein
MDIIIIIIKIIMAKLLAKLSDLKKIQKFKNIFYLSSKLILLLDYLS